MRSNSCLLPTLLVSVWAATTLANNLRLGNVRVSGHDATARTIDVTFNLQWDNSWRGVYDGVESWDAAWVFIKYKTPGASEWGHAWLSTDAGAHSAPAGVVDVGTTLIDGKARGIGAFIYSDRARAGGVIYPDMRLKWNYGAQGLSFNAGGNIEVSVHALEMVYVAQGAFWAGNTNAVLYESFRSADDPAVPARIETEDALTLHYGESDPADAYSVPDAFPKGVRPFYCMKYMVTQGQYVDFLNMQTRAYQAQLCSAVTEGRYMYWDDSKTSAQNWNTVHVADGTGDPLPRVYAANEPELLCNWIGWNDGIRYAAWAGLRPMTELEFEKTARGPLDPVENEYVWGDTRLAIMYRASTSPSNGRETAVGSGRASEGWNPDYSANACVRDVSQTEHMPRAGIFATTTSSRRQSGASYWGVMELCSGLFEVVVSLRDQTGLAFAGSHGDGTLAIPPDWPPAAYGNAAGIIQRGSSWYYAPVNATVASRNRINYAVGSRSMHDGWRAVRTAP